jgi:hypothetical protein
MRISRVCAVAAALAVAIAALVALPAAASARFAGSRSASLSVGSATLAPPSNVATTKKCTVLGIGGDTVTVNWTASPDQRVAGYSVRLDSSTSTDITRTVSGRTTTSVTVTVAAGATYAVTVTSTVGNWSAAALSTSVGCGLLG